MRGLKVWKNALKMVLFILVGPIRLLTDVTVCQELDQF